MFASLFDESKPLEVRIDTFKSEADAVYEWLVGKGKRISLGLISCLLAARDSSKYIFFRSSLIKNAVTRWGLKAPGGQGAGEKYVAYLEFLKPLQEDLSQQLGRKADLVDVHSWLWCDYSRNSSVTAGWRASLRDWLTRNPKTMPEELRQLRD